MKTDNRPAKTHKLDETVTLKNGLTVRLRPIEPRDAVPLKRAFELHMHPDDVRFRLFIPMKKLSVEAARRFTHIDPGNEMCLVLVDPRDDQEIWGGARIARVETQPDHGEFAVSVRSSLKGRGLAPLVLCRVLEYAPTIGINIAFGEVLAENSAMRALAARLGFEERTDPDQPGLLLVTKNLSDGPICEDLGLW